MTLWVDPPGAVALATRLRGMAAEVDESLSRAGAWEVMAAAAAVGLQRAITQADGVGAVQAARCVAEVETAVLQVVARVHALRGSFGAGGAFVRAAACWVPWRTGWPMHWPVWTHWRMTTRTRSSGWRRVGTNMHWPFARRGERGVFLSRARTSSWASTRALRGM